MEVSRLRSGTALLRPRKRTGLEASRLVRIQDVDSCEAAESEGSGARGSPSPSPLGRGIVPVHNPDGEPCDRHAPTVRDSGRSPTSQRSLLGRDLRYHATRRRSGTRTQRRRSSHKESGSTRRRTRRATTISPSSTISTIRPSSISPKSGPKRVLWSITRG